MLTAITIGAAAHSKMMPKATRKTKKSCVLAPIRVGIIDTGFGYKDLGHDAPLCQYGHKDFSIDRQFSQGYATVTSVPLDLHSHGTNIAGLIKQYADQGKNPYCFVIIKYYSEKQKGEQNGYASAQAFKYANNLNLDIINFSGGGPSLNEDEREAVKQLLDKGGKIVAAAGNESEYLDGVHNAYYPAMYDSRIKVVGNMNLFGYRVPSSNYGPFVNTWENGKSRTAYGITQTGTSQATAVATGKLIANMHRTCDR